MGSTSRKLKSIFLLIIFLTSTTFHAAAKTVFATEEVDMFPQGQISDQDSWYLDDGVTFTSDNSQFTESMVEDNRITIQHDRPNNFQSIEIWSQTSTSESSSLTNIDAITGAPDLQFSSTTGPVIKATDFEISPFIEYNIIAVNVVIAFHIPGALLKDQVRLTMNHGNEYDELVTFVNTQGPIDHMNVSHWTKNITDLAPWSWNDLSDIVFEFDYVSLGSPDDTQLDVDAVGLSVIVNYPWYGSEWASVESLSQGYDMPVMKVNLSDGIFDLMQLSNCGVKPSTIGTEGIWTSKVIQSEPGQKLGRIHIQFDSAGNQDPELLYSYSDDGTQYSDFKTIENHGLINSTFVVIKIISSQACLSEIIIDFNDPSLTIDGRIFGSVDGLVTEYSKWKVFVNDQEVTRQPIAKVGDFSVNISIGQYLTPGVNNLKIKVQAWFNWDSAGLSSKTLLEISSLQVSGGFNVEWDENPMCQTIGDQYLVEDGPGLLIPFLNFCQDDRDNPHNLGVQFDIADENLITAIIDQQDIKLVLSPEQSGITTITVSVNDSSNNKWTERFVVYVQSVDDPPKLNSFPSLIPVEFDNYTLISINYTDIDSNSLHISTNKSWATVDVDNSTITVNPPSIGPSIPILVTVCDLSTCVNKTLLLEVLILAELFIEDVIVDDATIVVGDVVPVRVYVRNSGQLEAASVSVRCQSDTNLIGIKSIPILRAGELGVVSCDWELLESGSANLTVEIDRANQILESNEANNLITVSIEVENYPKTAPSDSGHIDSGIVWLTSILSIFAIIFCFVLFAPKKIRKIE